MRITICLFLFSFSTLAQRPKSAFENTIDEINTFLYQTKRVQFINSDYDVFNVLKIKANKQGNVVLVDILTNDEAIANYKMFNLLEVKEFVGKGNEIQLLDKNNQKMGAFIKVNAQDGYEFIKDFRALQHICELYKNEDPKYKCE